VTASSLLASSNSITKGLTEGVARDVMQPRGALGGTAHQKDVTVNEVWIPVNDSSLRAKSYLLTEGGAVDVMQPRGDLCGSAFLNVFFQGDWNVDPSDCHQVVGVILLSYGESDGY